MRKKFLLSKFLVLLILITGSVGVASAQIAKIGDNNYSTLAEAVAAVGDGGTITLIDNVVLAERVTIPADKTLTIDLNGKSISMEEYIIATTYAINNLGNLTITDGVGNGSINARGIYNGYENVATAKITVLSGTINAMGTDGGAAIFNYGVADIQGGNFTSIGGYSLNNRSGASMTIAAGVTANNGIYVSGATLVVDGGEISGNRSGCHVLYAWNSNVTIAGGTFHNNNSGNSTTMAGGTTKLTINGGTFSIANGKSTNGWTSCLIDATNGGKYEINGGEFKGHFRVQANCAMEINGGTFENTHGEAYVNGGTVAVKGGTFTDAAAQKFATDNLAAGYELDANGTVAAKPAVAKIGSVAYETLQDAFDAVLDGETITLIDNVTVSVATAAYNDGTYVDGVRYTGDKSFTVDFNGKTVTDDGCVNDYLIYINNKGEKASEITFTNGTIVSANGCWSAVCVNSSAATQSVELNLNAMNITNSNDAVYSGNPVVRARELATVNVNNGTTITSNGASYGVAANTDGSTININEGATIVQQNSGTTGGNSVFAAVGGKGVINIKGGTITSDRYGVHTMTTGTPVINISGGTITAPVALKSSTNGGNGELATINVTGGTINGTLETYTDNGKIVVSGGTFSEAVAQEYCADGFVPVENADGTYGVELAPVAKVGENTYRTFAEAAAAAQAGDEIKLLANIEGDITVPANVTLNGNGFAISGGILAEGDITFAGVTTAADFDAIVANTAVNIPASASLQLTGSARLVIGHGATFNITGTIEDAKTADKATLVPSLKIAAGASITGNGVTFNVNNAYIVAEKYCSSKNSNANGTFNFNINNSIWNQTGNLQFSAPTNSMDPTVNFNLANSVLTTTGHVIFSVTKGEVVIDNSKVNEGVYRQIENRSTMTVKNGSVVNGAVAISENAKNPGTLIVENATYAVTGEFSGSDLGTGTIVYKKGATISATSITKANIQIDATGMIVGDVVNITAKLNNHTGTIEVINNNMLDAKIDDDGKIVLVEKPVAKIGETEYATLAEAIAAAEAGETVTLLQDVTLDAALVIEEGMDVTVSGEGKTITGCDGKDVFYVKGGKLTLTEGLNVHATTDCAIYLRGGDVFTAANLTKSGDKYSVIQGNGNYAGNVTITGGKVEASDNLTAIYWPQNGKLTITGGEITGHSAVYIASGSLEITGGKLHGVGANGSYEGVTGGSANAPGEALTIENVGGNSGYEEISSVVISGGEFISDNANAVGSYANTTQNPEAKPVAGFISGGTFDNPVAPEFCAAGFMPNENADGTYGVVVDPAYGKVAKVGDVYYATLAEAVAAADSGATITLLNGEHELPLFAGKELTFKGESKEGVIVNDAPTEVTQGWNGSTFHFENLTAKGANENYHGLANGVVAVTYKDCNINGLRFLYATEGVSFEGCAFNANGVEHSFWTYGASNVTVKNSTFTYTDRAVNCYSENGANHELVITFEGCSFAGTNATSEGAVEINSSSVKSIELVMNGCTAPENGEMWFNSQWDSTGGAKTEVIVDNVVVWTAPVKIGETKYGSLQAALDAAAAGTGNVTVEILRNIDLTGIDWNPVTVSAPGYPEVTVEGGNHKITGLNDMLFAGTWAGGSGLIIKNLTIENSAIVNDKDDAKGNVGVGAFIGYPQASATITLENCHLKDSHVEGGHWTGGLIGMAGGYSGNDGPVFMNLTIKGCSVTGSTITGKGSVGGVIGHGSCAAWTSVDINGTTVSGNTITSTGSSNVKAGAIMGTIGAAGQPTTVNGVTHTGGATVSATVSGNTVKSNNEEITTIYGRQGTPTGMLELNGGSYDNYPIEEGVTYAAPVEGYEIVKNTDGTYGVEKSAVAKIGDVEYKYLQAAFDAAGTAETTINVIANTTENITIQEGANITLEFDEDITLNGYFAPFRGKLTINDGTINNTNGEYSAIEINAGELNLNNVNIASARHAVRIDGDVEAIIDGGEYTLNATSGTRHAVNVSGGAEVTIEAGTFVGPYGTTMDSGSAVCVQSGATVTINGGDFSGGKNATLGVSGTMIVKGGTFDQNPSDYVPTGYTTQILDNGKYEVLYAIASIGTKYYGDLHEAMVAAKSGETVKLVNDVDLAGTEWEPVSFKGIFDGQDHIISNLTINKPGVSNTGFITSLNGTFKNVTFTNPTVTGGEGTAVVAGRAGGGAAYAHNITINGTIKVETTHSGYARTGGIVGGWAYGKYENITIDGGDKATSYIKHTGGGDGRYVAGIVGHADDVESYTNCTVKNITISGGWLCGGIAGPGPADGLATGCSVENIDMGADYSGGMFGWYYGDGTIKDATVKDVTFTDGSTCNGAIGGYSNNEDATVKNVTIDNVKNENGKPIFTFAATIADGTDIYYYATLEAAFTAATEGQTITLLIDTELSEMITIPNGKTVVLDLNGKTITGKDNTTKNFSIIDNRGNLTITDSSDPSTGKITLTATTNSGWNRYSAVIANNPGGKLTIEAGTLEHLGGTDMAYGIDNLTNGKGTYAETVINGGYIKSTYRAIRQFLNGTEAQNILTVNGGTIEGTNKSIWMQDPSAKANTGTLTVGEGATLKGDVYLSVTEGSTEWPVEVSIDAEALKDGAQVLTANVPAGYELQQDADGNYVVNQGVAKIGEVLYETLQEAINTVENDGTIVLIRDTDQNILAGNENLKPLNKVFTIDGDNHVVTGNWRFGRDDHNTDLSEITIKNVNFKGNGISILDFYKVTISECTFNDITTGNAIYVSADEYTSSIVVENCEMNNIEGAGINFRNPVNATVKGNKINGTGNNSITFQHGTAYTEAETGEYIIENNIFQNWANEASEGRALRIATGVKPRAITIENNVMIKDNAPEEFVKVTGNTDNVSVDENYWNGANPTSSNTPAYFLAEGVQVHNYYAAYDAVSNTLSDLVTIEGAGETLEIFYTAAGEVTEQANAAYSLMFTVTDYARKEVSIKIGSKKPAQNSAIHLVTPETVEFDNVEFDVTSVADNGFNSTRFKTVTISEGVATIGTKALANMSALTDIVFPSTLKSIGDNCFYGYGENHKIKTITCYAEEAPVAASHYTEVPFQMVICKVAALIVPNAVSYEEYATAPGWSRFYEEPNGSLINHIIGIGTELEIAGEENKYTMIATITSMDPMECSIKIGQKPASNSNAKLVLPEVVDFFPSVEGLDFTVTSIPDNAFSSCLYFVGNLVIPQNVRTIGAGAFNTSHFVANETVRGTLTLNADLVSIGSQAFKKDYFKGDLSIPSKVETIASNAFQYASFDGTLTINANINCANAFGGTGFTELVLVEGVEEIKDSNAFSGMSSLKEVVLPLTLQTVGMAAFKDDNAIEVIHTYATEVPAINSIPGNVNYKYAFSETVKANAVLYVHGTSYDDVLKYKNATNEWKEFQNIHLYGAVAQIGEVEYLTIQEAMDAAQNEDVVTIITDVELTTPIVVAADDNFTLNLNGHAVSYTTTEYKGEAMITNNGNLTITDTSDEETGSLSYAYEGGANSSYGFGNSTIENKGVLTINAGTVENTSAAMSHASYAINTGAGATLNVEGGNILNLNGHAVRMVSFGTELNTVNINGGYIKGTRALQVQLPGSASSTTKPAMDLNITGGELMSNEETYNLAIYVFSNGQSAENVSVEISGGTFNGNVAVNAAATNSMLANAVAITDGTFNGDYGVFSYSEEDAAQAVISITGGTFATNYSEWYAEDDYYVFEENEDGTYTVVEQTIFTQTTQLAQGWNWFSYYVNTDLTALETALGTNGVQITSKTDGFVAYNSQYGWSGNLSSITESQMYMINVGASHDLELSGELVGPTSITLHQGWNWIGFPMSEAVSVTDALAGFDAKPGDQIKSKDNGFASYNSQYGWGGALSTLNPGEGYMYQSNNSETTELFYSAGTRGELKANVTTDGNHWIPNAGQYPNNMTMTAMVEVEGGDYEVAAFVNGECRGSARPIYIEAMDAHILFLTIHGEDVEEMTFRYYDIATGEEFDLNDRMNYSNDAIVGTIAEPYIFSRGTTGIGEASLSEVNIYPNPTTTGTEINLQATCDKVEVFNALGVKVAEYQNVDSIDAIETAGIYVIRITNGGNVKHCSLVVK